MDDKKTDLMENLKKLESIMEEYSKKNKTFDELVQEIIILQEKDKEMSLVIYN